MKNVLKSKNLWKDKSNTTLCEKHSSILGMMKNGENWHVECLQGMCHCARLRGTMLMSIGLFPLSSFCCLCLWCFLFNSHIGPSQGSSRFASVLSGFTISIMGVNANHYLSGVSIKICGKILMIMVCMALNFV